VHTENFLWSAVDQYYRMGGKPMHTDAETDGRMFFC
jgi:hypothetical protein